MSASKRCGFLRKLFFDLKVALAEPPLWLLRPYRQSCGLILQALEREMHSLNQESFIAEGEDNKEQCEARDASHRDLYLSFGIYHRLGGKGEYRDFFTRTNPAELEEVP
jgi:hypothetical protein